MSDSSYSSTAPNPLHPGHAPRGLLKENRMGVSAGAAVPQLEHVGCAEKRRRSPFSSATATPSLHPGHAPRCSLKENRMGGSAGAAVPQLEHVGCAEKRRRSPFSSATATPSPSLKAVAT